MSKNRILRNFVRDWILPPKIKEALLNFRDRSKGKFLKDWKSSPMDTGLHNLPNFAACKLSPFWVSLDREARAAIILEDTISFEIKQDEIKYLQIGLGSPLVDRSNCIKIYVNEDLKSHIEDIDEDVWNDVRIDIKDCSGNINLKIEQKGNKQVYISHPIAIKNSSYSEAKSNVPKNIICLVIDAINFRYIKEKGSEIVPNIMEFFKDGTFCNQAYTQADWTLPAFSSLLTGLYVSRHGVCHPGPNEFALDKDLVTLPELMLKSGYRTFGYSSHLRFNPSYGHGKGFERFLLRPFSNELSFVAIEETIFHLEAHKNEKNFVLMHVFDTHPPYKPSSYLKNNFMRPDRDYALYSKARNVKKDCFQDGMDDEFSSKMMEFDLSLANLFSYLKRNNMLEDTLVLFTADHGLAFNENGRPRLFDERTHVPLMVRGPNISQKMENEFVECSVDMLPSILHCAGIDIPDHIDGRIWPFLGGEPKKEVMSESLYREKYSVVMRNNDRAYHLWYPFDINNRKIDFGLKKPVVVYDRKDFFDVEEDIQIDNDKMQEYYHRIEDMQKNFKKFY